MMILFVILAGLYLITVVGYYNMMFKTRELGPSEGSPLILRLAVIGLGIVWPLIISWSLLVQAIKR